MKAKTPLRRALPSPANCSFCRAKIEPDYKNAQELSKFVSERGKILGRVRSGLCAKHQRRLAVSVKRARHLGLLAFTGMLQ